MANEIRITVTSVDKSKPGIDGAGKSQDKFKEKVDKSSLSVAALTKQFEQESREADSLGQKLGKTGTFAEFLSTKLREARQETERLGVAANKTGSTDAFKAMRDSKEAEKAITDVGRALFDTLSNSAKKAGPEIGKQLSAGIQGGASTPILGPALIIGIVAAAVAVAPAAGAIIGGALAAGISTGVMGAGIALRFKDNPQVKAAGVDLGRTLMAGLDDASQSFDKPLLNGIQHLKSDLGPVIKDLKADFATLAPYVEQTFMYVGAAAEHIMPGFNKMIQSSGPLLNEMGKDLVIIADGAGQFFAQISSGSKGEAEGLRTLALLIAKVLAGTGEFIRILADLYDGLTKVGKGISDVEQKYLGWLPPMMLVKKLGMVDYINGIAGAFDDSVPSISGVSIAVWKLGDDAKLTTDDLDKMLQSLSANATTMDTVAGAMTDKVVNSLLAGDHAVLGFNESLTNLQDAFKQNGRQLDITTAKGQANREAVLAAVSANMQWYDANIAAGESADAAAFQYDKNTAALEKQLHAAGLTDKQITDLIGDYRNVPGKIDTEIATKGLTEALNNLGALIAKLNGLHDYENTVTTNYVENRKSTYDSQVPKYKASGGAFGGGLTWAHEQGPELMKLPGGTMIYPAGQSKQMAQSTGGSAAPSSVGVEFGGNLSDGVAALIMELIRTGKIKIKPQYVKV